MPATTRPPADAPTDALPTFPGWVTIEKLGEGGMCEVFRARPAGDGTGEERAIKVLMDGLEASIRRFVDEAALLARIDHPNVVRVHAIDAEARPPWLVMDLLAGKDLEETLRIEGRMDPERAARMFADLAGGLSAVHAAGVRHRDLKPANVRLGTDGVARLIDFGIARDASAARLTRQGFVVGTAAYLPPEVFTDDDAQLAQDSVLADVYALGQTLCEVLVGGPVCTGKSGGNEASVLVRIMREKLDREHLDPRSFGAAVPDTLGVVVRRATARDPKDRTPSAAALEQELRAFLAERESYGGVAPLSRVDLASIPPIPSPPVPERAAVVEASPVPAPPTGIVAPPAASTGIVAPPGPPTPVPPAPVSARSSSTSTPPARARAATPAPAPARSRRGCGVLAYGFVGGLGVAGTAAVVLLALAVAAAGAGALIAFRPRPAPGRDGVLAVVAGLDDELAACRVGPGSLSVSLAVEKGRATPTIVDSTVDRHTERCVTKALTRPSYPVGPPVTVEVPVVFR